MSLSNLVHPPPLPPWPGSSMPRVLALASLLLVIPWLTSCGSKRTSAHLAQVEQGMSSHQVEELLGRPDDIHVEHALGFTGTTLTYHGKDSDVKIMLVEDHVVSTSGKIDSN